MCSLEQRGVDSMAKPRHNILALPRFWGCVPPSTHGALNKVSRLMMLIVVGASRDIMPKAAF